MAPDPKIIWHIVSPVLLKRYKRTATFLDYRNPWELAVAVILSAQSTDDGVNKITPALFAELPDACAMGRAPIARIVGLIKRVNYHNAKARYLKAAGKMVCDHFAGRVPDTVADLQKLPGVGRKSAVAILSNAYNKNVGIPVDTHVIRFAHRFGLSHHRDASKIEQDLLAIIPKKDWKRAGYAIKEYGRKEGRARGYDKTEDPLWQELTKNNISI